MTARAIPEGFRDGFERGLISVVIPVFNGAGTLAESIESCLAQDYPKVEIVVVDDGSTDHTPEVLRRFEGRISIVTQSNKGLAAARNSGMLASRGEFLAWLDADDIALPNRLSAQAWVLQSHAEVVLVSSDFTSFLDGGADLEQSHIAAYYSAAARPGGLGAIYSRRSQLQQPVSARGNAGSVLLGKVYPQIVWGSFVHPPTVMLRRRVLENTGLCDEELHHPDYDYFIRAARAGEFAYIDAPLLRYRYTATQLSRTANRAAIRLETVRILDKVRLADPAFYDANRSALEARISECLLAAARTLGPGQRRRALALVASSLSHRLAARDLLHTLLSVLVPGAVKSKMKLLLATVGLKR